MSASSLPTKCIWDIGCIASIVGIWPRFIEPNLIFTTHLNLPIRGLSKGLEGLKIAQFSDLHLNADTPDGFLERLHHTIQAWKPSLVVFTGDLLCYGELMDPARLQSFLNRFEAPLGCYAIFGNHDYWSYVAVNQAGDYDIIEDVPGEIGKGFKRIFCKQSLTGQRSKRLANLRPHAELIDLLAATPFKVLENRTVQISVNDAVLNLAGVGEFMTYRFDPVQTFADYDRRYPGVVLAHNPDGVPALASCPGEVILCGHAHGGQVNLPWIRSRFVVMENPEFFRGTFRLGEKWVHINRGIGGTLRFRFKASPEVTFMTLTGAST